VLEHLAIYFGVMVAATSVLSLPLAPPTLAAAQTAAPWAVALTATCAAVVASCFDHWFVRRAFKLRLLERFRHRRLFGKAEQWARVAPFWTTALFAAIPLPFTIVRVLMPLSGYPMAKYVGAVALGRFPRIFVIASFGALYEIPIPILAGIFGVTVGIGAITALARHIHATRASAAARRAALAGSEAELPPTSSSCRQA
jgi:uncharacterized membrane protein YdjX (TVP38/TMEM64 family)